MPPQMSTTPKPPVDRDAEKLAELGYKQELTRVWSSFSNFAISFTIISVLAGCFTTYGQAWNNGGPIAISWGWPIICALIMVIAFSMGELASAYPTAGGPYWWAAKLGGPGWSWFTGWFNVIGLVAVVASVDYAAATFAASLFNLWGLDLGFITFADSASLDEIFAVFVVILALHAAINIFSSHLVALLNNVSVFVHVVGVAVIIAILVFVPDRHASADFVFTETINNSGFGDGMFWWYVLPLGLPADDVHRDRLRRLRARRRGDPRRRAGGRPRHLAGGLLLGHHRLVRAAGDHLRGARRGGDHRGGRRLDRDLHRGDELGLGRDGDPDLRHRPVLLRHGLRDELLAHLLRVLARPRRARLARSGPG